MKIDWKNKKVVVIGAGLEGITSAEWLVQQGAEVTVVDKKEDIKIVSDKDIKVVTGTEYLKGLDQYDVIVRSPGVKRDLPEIVAVEKQGILITSQTKIFFTESPAPIIGVTGTKGKGTTSSLIYEMLKAEELDVYLGGNIGVPPLTFLDKLTPSSWVVLELSSFQLEDLQQSPHIAVFLMVTNEHMEHHGDVMQYVDAKRNILRYQTAQDFAVINRDYPASLESDVHTEGKVYQVSREREVERGCFVEEGKIIIQDAGSLSHAANDAQESFSIGQDGSLTSLSEGRLPDQSKDLYDSESAFNSFARGQTPRIIRKKEILPVSDIPLPGRHNWENVCAAVMAATLAGVSRKSIAQAIRSFKGLEHRLELVRVVHGVSYYDDSIATNPESTLAAIQAFQEPKILVLGGVTEGSNFEELGTYISLDPSIKAIIGIGKEWEMIKSKVNPSTSLRKKNEKVKFIEGCKSMTEVVERAEEVAEPGDIVLLSPACKSFDMFKSYKDRGEQFKKAVMRL